MKTREEIGAIIREARKDKHWTQQKLGEKCGYEGRSAEATIQKWEYGVQPVPYDRLRALAEALGLDFDDLIP